MKYPYCNNPEIGVKGDYIIGVERKWECETVYIDGRMVQSGLCKVIENKNKEPKQ